MADKKIALFDMDYTITAYDTLVPFAGFVIRRAPWRLFYLLVFAPACALYVMRLIGRRGLKRAFLSVLWRMRREDVERIAAEFADTLIPQILYPEVLKELEKCRAQGMHTVLNTASPEFYVSRIASRCGFDESIGTRVRLDAVMPVLPWIEGENNRDIEKIVRMEHLNAAAARAAASDARLRKAPAAFVAEPFAEAAFTDSSADLPLLACARRKVLVNPSKKLEARGKAENWEILRPERPYSGTLEKYVRLCLCLLGLLKLK